MKMSSLTVTYCRRSQLPFRQNNRWGKMLKDCSILRYQTAFFEYTKSCRAVILCLPFTFPIPICYFLISLCHCCQVFLCIISSTALLFMVKIGHWIKPRGIKKWNNASLESWNCGPWLFRTALLHIKLLCDAGGCISTLNIHNWC